MQRCHKRVTADSAEKNGQGDNHFKQSQLGIVKSKFNGVKR